MNRLWVLVFAAVLFHSPSAKSCTSFELRNSTIPVMGMTFDWYDDFGIILTNKRHVQKQALIDPSEGTPLEWVSQYGSVTFNQAGREFPFAGVNERGLSVELLALQVPDASYPPSSDPRPAVNEFQWIQMILDRASNLNEAISTAQSTRIAGLFTQFRMHYLICDSVGSCGVFDYMNGKLLISSGSSLPISLLTNYPYPQSLATLGQPLPTGPDADTRFQRAAALMKQYSPSTDPVSYSFDILKSIGQGTFSKWNIVYELNKNQFYFRSLRESAIKSLNFSKMDFSCATPDQMLDINTTDTGDVSDKFVAYDPSVDAGFISKARVWTSNLVPEVEALPAKSTHCQE
jgi:penicillin V acylase-like amidase (Ntn superfamily)